MGKRNKRKNFNKVIVIDGFVNDEEIDHFFYVIKKYGLEQAAYSLNEDRYPTHIALEILDNECNISARIVKREEE